MGLNWHCLDRRDSSSIVRSSYEPSSSGGGLIDVFLEAWARGIEEKGLLHAVDLGRELLQQLDDGYDIVRIARWAYQLFLDSRGTGEDLRSILMKLVVMEEGPEFELSESELRQMAQSLMGASAEE
jgi:hypothetical protein